MIKDNQHLERLLTYYATEHRDPIWDKEVERNFPDAWRYIVAMRKAFKKPETRSTATLPLLEKPELIKTLMSGIRFTVNDMDITEIHSHIDKLRQDYIIVLRANGDQFQINIPLHQKVFLDPQ